jgi:hypothetical protein
MIWLAEGVRLMSEGRFAEAAAAFEQGHKVARAARIDNTYVAPLLPWLATALREQAQNPPDPTPAQRKALLRRARMAAHKALRVARRFQNDLPHSLRENALLAALAGRREYARRLFDESLAVAEQQGARYEYAQTLLARGQAGKQFGWPDSTGDVSRAEQSLRTISLKAFMLLASYIDK